jgi:opacity protein-like surface antigen
MKKFIILTALLALGFTQVEAQEITSYDTDSTAYYNMVYGPDDYAQAPIKGPQRKVNGTDKFHTSINLGTGFGNGGYYQYLSPMFNYDISKKWTLNIGTSIAYSTFKVRDFENVGERSTLHALTNYYSVGATYNATERLSLYGDVIYGRTMPTGNSSVNGLSNDGYMATFGATFNISKSLSIGIEVRSSRNMNPYGIYNNPYSPWNY